jgi:hypothetical protein
MTELWSVVWTRGSKRWEEDGEFSLAMALAQYCTRCSFCTALLFHKLTHRTSSRLLQSGNHQLVYTFSEFWTCCLRYVLVSKLHSGGEEELKEGRRHYWMQWEVNFLRSYLEKLSFDGTHWLWQTDVQSHSLSVETSVLL